MLGRKEQASAGSETGAKINDEGLQINAEAWG
jgi:hypothetical protein